MKKSIIMKTLCYLSVPILVIIIIINSISIAFAAEYEQDMKGYTDYFNTEKFADNCLMNVYYTTRNIIRKGQNNELGNATIIEELKEEELKNSQIENAAIIEENKQEEGNIQYNLSQYTSNTSLDIIIIFADGVYTNIEKTTKTDTMDKLKQYVESKDRNWIYSYKTIKTNMDKMKYENIAYDGMFEYIQNNTYEVYVSIKDENNASFQVDKMIYEVVSKTYLYAPIMVMISGIALLIACIYIIISIGHKKGQEELYTNSLDKIPLEIVIAVAGILVGIEFFLVALLAETTSRFLSVGIPGMIIMGIAVYITLAITGVTLIRRIKLKTFFKESLCYKVIHYLKKGTTHLMTDVFNNFSRISKVVIAYIGFICIIIVLVSGIRNFFFVLLLFLFLYFVFRKLLKEINKVYEIRDKIKDMYNGNIKEELKEENFKGEMREVVHELNDIAGGLCNAMEQGLKNERLKTELITNVSHDIKTPLTSIINYVDLLKKENIQNDTVKEYLEILDNKSQRLKKLTEDLVEASKASSGNIKLDMEKLNVKELMKQLTGEFEDKLDEKGLEMIESVPTEEITIQADSQYMYRVMENIYTNIVKYALENSRVYVDVTKKDNKVEIAIKNISKDKLNITVDELMQRFVRGDTSRTTEGSGLGISIAKSLTELQKGKFDLYLDGDLFKVVIQFDSI